MSSTHVYTGSGFEIHFSLTSGVLRAQVEGPHDSLDVSIAYWKEIVAERVRHGVTRLLVVENLADSTRTEVTLSMADELLKLDLIGCRVAFVDRGVDNRSVQELIAMRARDQGIIAAVFGDEGQAINWLRHGID